MGKDKLSEAQRRMLDEVQTSGESRPPWGYSSAGLDAAAWHRTANSLVTKGLLLVQRGANSFRAVSPTKAPR